MKQQGLRIFAMLAFYAMLAAAPANAQSQADIPFDFQISNEKIPAGQYTVTRSNQNSGTTVLLLRNADGRGIEMFVPMSVQARESQDQGKLVFHKYGDQYFLYQVWEAGTNAGHELRKSRRERAVERELAKAHRTAQRETVALILHRR
ncbi:MAG: hypothetical protein H0T92_09230 [Pyrinomonadaceae bacterium]|nr:hypothetical protein [Pyrinomonadaceae bacterium]